MTFDERAIERRVALGFATAVAGCGHHAQVAVGGAGSTMNVQVVTSPDAFTSLRADWDALTVRAGLHCLFLTHDWFDAAWQWRRESGTLFILGCWRDGRLEGVMPLVRLHVREGGGARALEFLAVPDTQKCDLIVEPGQREAVVTALVGELVRRQAEWDVLRMRYLPADSIAATTLAPALAARGLRSVTREVAVNLTVALDSTWDAYYATRSRRLKKAANLVANRLAKSGDVTIAWRAPGAIAAGAVDAIVAEITDVSARSWKAETGNSLDHPGPQAFIRRLSQHGAARGWLSVWSLRVNDRLLAMEYQVVADGDVYALRSDFDADCDKISPGSHLSRHLLEQLFGRGLRRYLMGPGSNAYKLHWAAGSVAVHEMHVYGTSMAGRGSAAWELWLKPLLRRVRDRFRGSGRATDAPTPPRHED